MTDKALRKDTKWSSDGLQKDEAIDQWQDWAASTIAPIDVELFDADAFAAKWTSHGLGQLRFLHLLAPAQRVVHRGQAGSSGRAAPTIQLIYSRDALLDTQIGGKRFPVHPGEIVLLDNTRFYQMDMLTPHDVVDVMMPRSWLGRYVPDIDALLGRAISVSSGWGAPLGSLLETMTEDLPGSPLPRSMIAEQLGSLLLFATGSAENAAGRHGTQLTRQILRRIETDFADPELCVEGVADDLGISRRSLQALLTRSGTSFIKELTATRLDRAIDHLGDRALDNLNIGEIAFRCGYTDAGYFTRLFKKRFGLTPSQYQSGTPGSNNDE